MKRTIIMIMTLGLSGSLLAQGSYTHQVQGNSSDVTVEVINLASELDIEGHDSDQVVITANGYDGVPEKAKGLRALSAYGEDNTELGLFLEQKGNVIQISGASRAARDADYTIRIPQSAKLKIDSEDWNADIISVEGIKNEVEIKTNSSDLELNDMTGPLVLTSLNGEIEIDLSSLSQSNPSSISATNGDVDIALPGNSKADLKLSCLNGEIYTDLDFDIDGDRGDLSRIGGGINTDAKIGGGGVQFSIRALNGNIYLRKK